MKLLSLIEMTVSGGALILAVMLVRALVLDKLPKRAFLVLWALAAARLLGAVREPPLRLPALRLPPFAPDVVFFCVVAMVLPLTIFRYVPPSGGQKPPDGPETAGGQN